MFCWVQHSEAKMVQGAVPAPNQLNPFRRLHNFNIVYFRLQNMTEQFTRLPRSVIPQHYEIHLTPNFTTFKFDGEVNINVAVLSLNLRSILKKKQSRKSYM